MTKKTAIIHIWDTFLLKKNMLEIYFLQKSSLVGIKITDISLNQKRLQGYRQSFSPPCLILYDVTVDWISTTEDDRLCLVYIFQHEFLTYANTLTSSFSLFTPSLLQTHTWIQSGSASQTTHTRTGTSRDDYHYSASSKYSNSIRGDTKGLIRADELPSQVPFFLLLLIAAISGCVGARCCLITLSLSLSNEPIFHVDACRGDVPPVGVIACGVRTHSGWMLNVVHFTVECHEILVHVFTIQFSVSTF